MLWIQLFSTWFVLGSLAFAYCSVAMNNDKWAPFDYIYNVTGCLTILYFIWR